MIKKDLKNGDWVEYRNGKRHMFIATRKFGKSVFSNNKGYMHLSEFNNDLTCNNKDTKLAKKYDIMKVWRITDDYNNGYLYNGNFISETTLLWERKEVEGLKEDSIFMEMLNKIACELGCEVKVIEK